MRKESKKQHLLKSKNNIFANFLFRKKNHNAQNQFSEIDRKILRIHKSGQTHFKALSGVHNHLRSRSRIYYKWHLNPHHRTVHLGTLAVTSLLVITMVLSSVFTDPNLTKAANFAKNWSSTADFNSATNNNISTENDQSSLAKSSTDFTENFNDISYKDGASTANWDATNHKLTLPGDPSSGTATDLQTKWKSAVAVNESVASVAYDSTNKYVYMGGSAGGFVFYKPSTGEMFSLTSKIKTAWSTNGLNSMKFDVTNGVIYFGSADKVGGLGAYIGGSDPANGTFVNLESKVTADWSGGKIQSITYDSFAGKVYVGGALGGFGVFAGGSDPASGMWTNLTSKISGSWSTNPVNSLAYDSGAKNIYLAGGASTVKKFGSFAPGSDPANGTWTSLDSKITDADWGSNLINALYYDSTNSKIYLGGQNSKFGSFTGGSDPANGTWVSLTSKIMGDWAGTTVGRMSFDSTNGILYLTGRYRFGAYKGGSDPANGTYYALGSKFGADWPSTFSDITFDSYAGNIYIGAGSGRFGNYSAISNPSNGTVTNRFDLSAPFFKSYAQPQSSTFDSTNNIVYYGDEGGNFLAYNTSTGSAVNLKSRISGSWGNSAIYAMDFDSTNHNIYLVGPSGRFGSYTAVADPTTGVWTYLNSKISSDWSTNAVANLTVDNKNGKVYIGGANGKFGAFAGGSDPANGTWTYLSSKISADWSTNSVDTLTVDSVNDKIYIGGVSGKFGAFAGGSDPANGTWTYLSSKISADWSTGNFYALTFDSANGYVYLGGAGGRFGAFLGGATPSSGTWINLYSKISSDISNQNIYALKFTSGRLFIGSTQGRFGAYVGGSDPANGTWSNLANKISPFWANDGNNGDIYTITYAPSAATVYFGGPGGKIASYLAGFSSNKDGISTKVNATSQKILQATMATISNIPTHTGATFYLSNDGGSTWETVTLNSLHTFTSVGADLRWKINLTSTDVLVTPEITNVTVNYSYYSSNNGTQNFVFDAGVAIVPYTLSWSKTISNNTSLTFKIRSADSQSNLASSVWSDSKTGLQSPVNLMSINVDGAIGVPENRWIEIQVDYSTSDGLNSAILEELNFAYVLNVRPEVQNVVAAQKNDGSGLVEINYEIRDQDTKSNPYNPGQIEVLSQYSLDAGSSWNDCVTKTNFGLKDVDETEFTSYQGTWDMGAVLSNKTEAVVVRLLVNDNELAKNTAQANSASFTIDTKAPVAGDTPLIINSAQTKTNNRSLNLELNVSDDSDLLVAVAEDGQSFNSWQSYNSTISFTLTASGDGTKSINVKVKDAFGNELSSVLSGSIELDTFAPSPNHTVLVDGSIVEQNDYRVLLSWDTLNNTDFAAYTIERSVNDQNNFSKLTEFESRATNAYSDRNLNSADTYYYRMYSEDSLGNKSAYSDVVSMKPSGADSTPPEITGPDPKATPSSISAEIDWLTDESADSFIDFGKTTDFGSTQGKVENTKNHIVTLVGLDPDTLYYFRVRTRDASGNLTLGETFSFQTKSAASEASLPNISGATAQKAGADPEEVTIIWATDKPSTSQVMYGLTENNLNQESSKDSALNTTHYVQIKKLKSNTKYYYQACSIDQYGNEKRDEVKYFVTADTANDLPSISAVKVSDITMNSAIITWKSNVVATSTLKYGISDGYGSTIDDLSLGSTTIHTVRLSDLKSGTEYHFRVLGLSTANLNICSDDYVFSTLTLPVISNVNIRDISSDKATITWQTNVGSDSFVDFGTEPQKLEESQGRSEEVSDHVVTLNNLKPNTNYIIRTKSRDKYSNLATSENMSFKTIVDTTAPVIRDLKSETSNVTDSNGESRAQVIVSWSTDEPASSQIKYSQGVVAGNSYAFSTQEDSNLTTSHVVIISNLQPSTTYHMMILSKDSSSNIGTSDDYSVITLTQDKSLVQYIIQILEDRFSWIRGFGLFGN